MDNPTLYQLAINLNDDTGTDIISLVKYPAMESNFQVAFSKEEIKFSHDEKTKTITGVIAIPGKKVPRIGNKSLVLTKEEIEKDAIKFFKRAATRNVNLEHATDVKDCYVCQSWVTGKVDKAHAMFGELPEGTWCVSMAIENESIWSKIQSGEIKGFSLEGDFDHIPVSFSSNTEDENKIQRIKDLLKIIA